MAEDEVTTLLVRRGDRFSPLVSCSKSRGE